LGVPLLKALQPDRLQGFLFGKEKPPKRNREARDGLSMHSRGVAPRPWPRCSSFSRSTSMPSSPAQEQSGPRQCDSEQKQPVGNCEQPGPNGKISGIVGHHLVIELGRWGGFFSRSYTSNPKWRREACRLDRMLIHSKRIERLQEETPLPFCLEPRERSRMPD